jgi:hypothetical protein
MVRRKKPDTLTAEEEVRSVLAWAKRMGFENIADALTRALDKWPEVTAAREQPKS